MLNIDIGSLDVFFSEYTPYETLGKEFYKRAIETHHPELLSVVTPAYDCYPQNVTRSEYSPIKIWRHERYVKCRYHTHNVIELIYLYKGSCLHILEGQTSVITENEIFLLSPGVFHLPEIYDDSILINVLIYPEALTKLCDAMAGLDGKITEYLNALRYGTRYPRCFSCKIGDDDKLRRMFHELIREYFENRKCCDLIMQNLLQSIFCILLRSHEEDSFISDYTTAKISPAIPLLQYINENHHNTTLGDLSCQFSYSEQHICRLIKAHTGKTFSQYLTDIRLSKAKILLLTTDLSVADIAHRCGYSGNAYFCRLFKKTEGLTPMAFKTLHLNNNTAT